MAFKMKGSPMYRNYGIGSPAKKYASSPAKMTGDPEKEMTQEEKDAAIANAIPAAEKKVFSRETMNLAKSYGFFTKSGGFNTREAKNELARLRNMSEPTDHNLKQQAEIRRLMKAFDPRANRNYSN